MKEHKNQVLQLLGRLRSDDLYHLLAHYPETGERSTALGSQAAMLYTLLYFVPDTLRQETAFMREVVDKFFCDNWVLPTYMGHVVWLPEAWDSYRAAKAAVTNTTATAEVRRVAAGHGAKLRQLVPVLRQLLTEGCVTQESLLDRCRTVHYCTLLYCTLLYCTAGQRAARAGRHQGEQRHPAVAGAPHPSAQVCVHCPPSLESILTNTYL